MSLQHGLVMGCLLFVLPLQGFSQERAAGVATEFVSTTSVAETVPVFGQVVAGRQSDVAARVAGVASEVPTRVGDRVSKGDLLARLDTELLQIEVAQAQAEIAIAEAGLAVADARLQRAQDALKRAESLSGTISLAQLEERTSDFSEAVGSRQEANARINAAQNQLAQALYRMENATITAPFDAVVLEVATEIGQFISVGSQVASLIDIEAMEVEANVPARFINALGPETRVEARTDAGGQLDLALRAILPTEFSATRTRPVRFSITGQAPLVAVGQSVTLQVPVNAPRDVVVVPKDALVQAGEGWSVFVHVDGTAMPRMVDIGMALGGGFEVLSGLTPGDEVVVRGNERLRPGQAIAPFKPAPAAGGGGEGTDTAPAATSKAGSKPEQQG